MNIKVLDTDDIVYHYVIVTWYKNDWTTAPIEVYAANFSPSGKKIESHVERFEARYMNDIQKWLESKGYKETFMNMRGNYDEWVYSLPQGNDGKVYMTSRI